jgi:hypothetical protein
MLLSCPAFILKKSGHSTHSHCVPSSKNLAACQDHIDTVTKLHMEKAKYTLASWPVFAHWYLIGLHDMLSEAVSISVIAYTRKIRDNRCPVRSSQGSVHGRGAGSFSFPSDVNDGSVVSASGLIFNWHRRLLFHITSQKKFGSVVRSKWLCEITLLTLRVLMSYIYIYGVHIPDVSRSHTTTYHSR